MTSKWIWPLKESVPCVLICFNETNSHNPIKHPTAQVVITVITFRSHRGRTQAAASHFICYTVVCWIRFEVRKEELLQTRTAEGTCGSHMLWGMLLRNAEQHCHTGRTEHMPPTCYAVYGNSKPCNVHVFSPRYLLLAVWCHSPVLCSVFWTHFWVTELYP